MGIAFIMVWAWITIKTSEKMRVTMVLRIKNRHRLKEREAKELISTVRTRTGFDSFDVTAAVDVGTLEDFTVVLVNDSVDFFLHDNQLIPTLQGIAKYQPKTHGVIVDMGAISFITKGADVMAPGITDADLGIQKDDVVWICDEKHHKTLAVGIALMTGEEMKLKQPGKAVRTLHYVGDRLWALSHQ
jgi:PUA-domain protein